MLTPLPLTRADTSLQMLDSHRAAAPARGATQFPVICESAAATCTRSDNTDPTSDRASVAAKKRAREPDIRYQHLDGASIVRSAGSLGWNGTFYMYTSTECARINHRYNAGCLSHRKGHRLRLRALERPASPLQSSALHEVRCVREHCLRDRNQNVASIYAKLKLADTSSIGVRKGHSAT